MTLDPTKYETIACEQSTGELYRCYYSKAVADIQSQFQITELEAKEMLHETVTKDKPEIVCPAKNTSYWMEPL